MAIQITFVNGNNPFTHMAGSLGARPVPDWVQADPQAKPLSPQNTPYSWRAFARAIESASSGPTPIEVNA